MYRIFFNSLFKFTVFFCCSIVYYYRLGVLYLIVGNVVYILSELAYVFNSEEVLVYRLFLSRMGKAFFLSSEPACQINSEK